MFYVVAYVLYPGELQQAAVCRVKASRAKIADFVGLNQRSPLYAE